MRRILPRALDRKTYDLDCSIEATDSEPERRATLRNMSQSGARLEGPEVENCPEEFELRIVHASGAVERLPVKLVWRQPGCVGVRFADSSAAFRSRIRRYSRAS